MVASVPIDSDSDVVVGSWGVAEDVQDARMMDINDKLVKVNRLILSFLFLLHETA